MHRSYNSYNPVASKLLQKRWDDNRFEKHRHHVKTAKSDKTTDSGPPVTFMHLHLKLKKLQVKKKMYKFDILFS